jgi:hypothetical protein
MKDRNVCCYIYHVKMEELRVDFNFVRKLSSIHTNSTCNCNSMEVCGGRDGCGCKGHLLIFPGTTSKMESILCPLDEFTKWHDRKCVFGECEDCGIAYFLCCPIEEQGKAICVDFYISFERFVNYEFPKPLSTNILCFKRCKYVYSQKSTFLVHNMTLQK